MDKLWLCTPGLLQEQRDRPLQSLGARCELRRQEIRHVLRRIEDSNEGLRHRSGYEPNYGEWDLERPRASHQLGRQQ